MGPYRAAAPARATARAGERAADRRTGTAADVSGPYDWQAPVKPYGVRSESESGRGPIARRRPAMQQKRWRVPTGPRSRPSDGRVTLRRGEGVTTVARTHSGPYCWFVKRPTPARPPGRGSSGSRSAPPRSGRSPGGTGRLRSDAPGGARPSPARGRDLGSWP